MICKKTLKKYCCNDISKIENYDEAIVDSENSWVCHHRLETHNSDGERRLVDISKEELIALDMYWHRPSTELILMTKTEHRKLHMYGNTISKGNEAWNKGLHLSEETKKKASETVKAKSLHWYTNGVENVRTSECPEGFWEGRTVVSNDSVETRRKKGASSIGKHWFNNGIENIKAFECPEGFKPGRLTPWQ